MSGRSRRGPADRRRRGGRSGTRSRSHDGSGRGAAPRRARGLGGDQVEGRHAVRELLGAGRRTVREVMVADDLDPAPILDEIVQLASEARVPVRRLSRSKLDALAHTDGSQGVIAAATALAPVELDALAAGADGVPFLLVVDGVTDPGNLGALLRTAECAGVTGVVLPRHRAVHVTPTVAKAAAGAIEHLPMAVVGGLPAAMAELRDAGVWLVGLDAGGDRPLWHLETATEPVAVVLGAEGRGLSRLVRERCDVVVSIPMAGHLDALNVAAAGALACFEIARARAPAP